MEKVVKQLREIFKCDEINTEEVRELMEGYCSNRADWKKFAHFDPHKYTRNLVDMGNGKYNLMILCWPPGLSSNIHDHTDSHCFVKVLDGTLRETRFEWPKEEGKPMDVIQCTDAQVNDVSYMSDKLGLHRMENPSYVDGAISLHLYVPPYSECQTFDQRTGVRSKATVTFFTKYGRKVDYKGSKEGKLVGKGELKPVAIDRPLAEADESSQTVVKQG